MLEHRKPKEQRIDYEEAVREGKQIMAQMAASRDRLMRLGELAHKVETKYNQAKLKQFATDIGVSFCTLARCRSVFRQWSTEGKEGAPPVSFAVAQALQAHPRRFELIKDKPNMTMREARRLARQESKKSTSAPDHRRQEDARWWRGILVLAGKLQGQAGGFVDSAEVDWVGPPLRQNLRGTVDATQLPDLREAGRVLIRLADYLERLVTEEDEEPSEQLSAEAAE